MNKISGARILVLGDTGYLGSEVANYYAGNNEVIGISRSANTANIPWKHLSCDLSDLTQLRSGLKNEEFDYVFNLAGCVDHRTLKNGGAQVIRDHILININTMEMCFSKRLKRYIVLGSADEYTDKTTAINETDPIAAFSPYSFSKLAISQLIQSMWVSDQFPGTVGRLFLAYGPNQGTNRVIPNIINKCKQGLTVDLSPGDQLRDFVFIDDVLDCLNSMAIRDSSSGEIFNIGSGTPIKLKSLAVKIQSIIGKGNLNFGGVNYRPGEKMIMYGDISKAKSTLGWSPKFSLEEGLQRTINSFIVP